MTASSITKRPRLDRSTVITAARDLLDEQGIAGLSMARLGERLGVTAMALYRHVRDRSELERAVVELVLGELANSATAEEEWEAGVAAWMHSIRRCWIAHPWVGGLLGSRTELSPPWLAVIDRLAATLERAPLGPAKVAQELVLISRSTIGVLWLEVNAPLPQTGLTDSALAQLPITSRRRWKSLTRTWRRYDNDDLFDDLVADTLDRLRALST